MKGASVKVAILSFFSSHGLYFHHAKNQPLLRPPSPFSEHLPLFWPYLFSKKFYETFLVQNLGHNHLKKCNICCLGGLLKEKRESTSDLFSTFQKPYWPSCPIVQWISRQQSETKVISRMPRSPKTKNQRWQQFENKEQSWGEEKVEERWRPMPRRLLRPSPSSDVTSLLAATWATSTLPMWWPWLQTLHPKLRDALPYQFVCFFIKFINGLWPPAPFL